MHVLPIEGVGDAGNPFKRCLDSLIFSVGTGRFDGTLFETARQATGCEHLTAFAISSDGEPRMLFAANTGQSFVARQAGELYVSRYWHEDPANRLHDHRDVAGPGLLARVTADEIRHSEFRKSCYSSSSWSQIGAKMIDRISLFRKQGSQTIKVSFHRAKSAGPFHDSEIQNIVDSADVLIALMARHGMSSKLVMHHCMRGKCVQAVRAMAPDLSEREAEVCAGIVLGTSSEGIALSLQISINTVRTYRKRAYTRLNIYSQNELMRLVLPYLSEVMGDSNPVS